MPRCERVLLGLVVLVAFALPAQAEGVSGSYQVTGVTTETATGVQRTIEGRIVVKQEGDAYTASFELSTTFPGSDAVAAKVLGTGSGTVAGNAITGKANTQLMAATAPGVDVDFAFIPRAVSTRIVSSSTGSVGDDGTIRLEIVNEAVEGEDYTPTKTLMVGVRLPETPSPETPSAETPSPETPGTAE